MRADRKSGAVEVGDQALFLVHRSEGRALVGFSVLFEEWAGGADGAFDLPEGVAAVEVRVPSTGYRVARIVDC
jgi:hypothetical protein